MQHFFTLLTVVALPKFATVVHCQRWLAEMLC
jgi:hypothetical protein